MSRVDYEREAALLPRGARAGSDLSLRVTGLLLATDTTAYRVQVSIGGGQPVWLPTQVPITAYAGAQTVNVIRNPITGRAEIVAGPCGPWTAEGVPTPPGPAAGTQTATTTILPTWSGTWRATRWDNWNQTRYGGRSDLYQGNAYGSGPLVGLATYGDQLVGLGATTITAAVLTVERNGSGGAAAVTVQGSSLGTPPAGAPSSSGDTASSASLAATGKGQIALTAGMREALRTGAAKGLCLVGATYAGVFGTSRGDGMSLFVTYTRPA